MVEKIRHKNKFKFTAILVKALSFYTRLNMGINCKYLIIKCLICLHFTYYYEKVQSDEIKVKKIAEMKLPNTESQDAKRLKTTN